MITPVTFAAVLASVSALAAQSVGVTVSALTPLTVQVTDGVATNVLTLPAGVLPAQGSLQAILPSAATLGAAGSQWRASATNRYAAVHLTHALQNSAALRTFAGRCGPHEFLVEFTSAIPRATTLTVSRQLGLGAGAPSPTVQVDIGNDGVIDVVNPSSVTSSAHALSFGPQPLQVRVVVDAALGAQVGTYDEILLALEPDNDLVVTQPVATCAPSAPAPPPVLAPSFDDRGVEAWLFAETGEFALLVFGFTPHPTLLATNGALPCILLPSPDVLLLGNGLLHVPLPPSVRPATFYAQGVRLTQSGLRTTEGYSVQAN